MQNEFSHLFRSHQESLVYYNFIDDVINDDTRRIYKSGINELLKWCTSNGVLPFAADRNDLLRYQRDLVLQNHSARTINLRIVIARRLYKAAIQSGIIQSDPTFGLHTLTDRGSRTLQTNYVSAASLNAITAVLPSDNSEESLRAKAIIQLIANQGLRIVDLYYLSEEGLDFRTKSAVYTIADQNKYIFFRDEVWEAIVLYLAARGKSKTDSIGTPLFRARGNRAGGKRLSRDSLRDIVNAIYEKAGIKEDGIVCYTLRHTFAQRLYSKTNDLRLVQEELRLKTLTPTYRYSDVIDLEEYRVQLA